MNRNSKTLKLLLLVMALGLTLSLAACDFSDFLNTSSVIPSYIENVTGLQDSYNVGDSIDYEAIEVKVVMSDKTTLIVPLTDTTYKEVSTSSAGDKELSITYKGIKTSFIVYVVQPQIVSQLSTPSNVRYSGTLLMWAAVANSTTYEVSISYNGGTPAVATTNENSYDFSEKVVGDGTLTLMVRAISSSSLYTDSAYSSVVTVAGIVKLDTPRNLVLNGTVLSWNAVSKSGVAGIYYIIKQDNGVAVTTANTSFELRSLNLGARDTGYKYSVIAATTQAEVIQSAPTGTVEYFVKRLDTPALTVTGRRITWNSVAGATAYQLRSGVDASGAEILVTGSNLSSSTLHYDLGYTVVSDGEFVYDESTGKYVAYNFNTHGSNIERLTKGYYYVSTSGGFVYDASAGKYVAYIPATHGAEAKRYAYDANAYTGEGNYDFRITAIGNGTTLLNSYISEKATFSIYKLPTPTGLFVDDNEVLSWWNVAGDVVSYSVYKKVGDSYVLVKDKIYDSQAGSDKVHYVSFDISAISVSGEYEFCVVAVGNGDTVRQSNYSAINKYTYIIPLAKPNVTLNGGRLSWNSITGASRYEIHTQNGIAATTSGTYIDIASIDSLGYGTFNFKIRAIPGDINSYKNSEFAVVNTPYLRTYSFSNLNVSVDANNVASWAADAYAEYYVLYIEGYRIDVSNQATGLVAVPAANKTIVISGTSYDLDNLGAGYYTALQFFAANSNSTVYKGVELTSVPNQAEEVYGGEFAVKGTLGTPSFTIASDGTVSWSAVNLAVGYTVKLYLSDVDIKYSSLITSLSYNLGSLPEFDITSIDIGAYKVEVVASTIAGLQPYLTNENVFTIGNGAFTVSRLATPVLSLSYIIDDEAGHLSRKVNWTAVNGANGYRIYATDGVLDDILLGQVAAGVTTFEFNNTADYASVINLFEVGDYTVKVEAVGNGGNLLTGNKASIIHAVAEPGALAAPANVRIEYGVAYWDGNNSADGYRVKVYRGTYMEASGSEPEGTTYYYNDNGTYILWVAGTHPIEYRWIYEFINPSVTETEATHFNLSPSVGTEYMVTVQSLSYKLNVNGGKEANEDRTSPESEGVVYKVIGAKPYSTLDYDKGIITTVAEGPCTYKIVVTNGNNDEDFVTEFVITAKIFSENPGGQQFKLFDYINQFPSGNLTVNISLKGSGGYADSVATLAGTFVKLATTEVELNSGGLRWAAVEGATDYKVVIDSQTYTLASNPSLYTATGGRVYLNSEFITNYNGIIYVTAISNSAKTANSNISAGYSYTKLAVPDVIYDANDRQLQWTEISGVTFAAAFVDQSGQSPVIYGQGSGLLRIDVPETRALSDYQITATRAGSVNSSTWSQVRSNVADFNYGLGTVGSPYLIENRAQFAAMEKYSDKYFKLIIDFTDNALTGTYNALSNWTPVNFNQGNYLFGNRMTVSYSIINTSSANYKNSGLFATNKGTIENLFVTANIVSTVSAAGITANVNAGGVAAVNQGVINNVTVKGRVEGTLNAGGIAAVNYGTIIYSGNYALVASYGNGRTQQSSAGGVTGENSSGSIEWCYSVTNINENLYFDDGKTKYNVTAQIIAVSNSNYAVAGGIVGYGQGSGSVINANYSYSHVSAAATGSKAAYAGGFAGWTKMGVDITNGLATGNVSAVTLTSGAIAGGFAASVSGQITYCYCLGEVSATSNSGSTTARGFLANKLGYTPAESYYVKEASGTEISFDYEKNLAVSVNDLKNPTVSYVADTSGAYVYYGGSYVAYNSNLSEHTGLSRYRRIGDLFANFSSSVWDAATIGSNYQFPHLIGEKYLIRIENETLSTIQLEYATEEEGGLGLNTLDGRISMSTDTMITRYYTTLQIANNDWVYNIITDMDYQLINREILSPIAKFMGTVYGNNRYVKNFKLDTEAVGNFGVILKNFGIIYNLNAQSFDLSVYSNSTLLGDIVVGALCAYNYGIIEGCSASNGVLSAIAVKGTAFVGGLVGVNSGIIRSYAATHKISSADVDVVGKSMSGRNTIIGGLVGDNAGGYIIDAYAEGFVEVQGTNYLKGGLVGRNTNPIDYYGAAIDNIVGCTYSVDTGCDESDNQWGTAV